MDKATKSQRGYAMSDEEPVGIKAGEWFFGILTIIIGFMVFYFTFTSYSTLSTIVSGLPNIVPGTFLCFGGLLMIIGAILILAKRE
jgi:nitrate reductase gamma subunit